jgi:hypothetical protein
MPNSLSTNFYSNIPVIQTYDLALNSALTGYVWTNNALPTGYTLTTGGLLTIAVNSTVTAGVMSFTATPTTGSVITVTLTTALNTITTQTLAPAVFYAGITTPYSPYSLITASGLTGYSWYFVTSVTGYTLDTLQTGLLTVNVTNPTAQSNINFYAIATIAGILTVNNVVLPSTILQANLPSTGSNTNLTITKVVNSNNVILTNLSSTLALGFTVKYVPYANASNPILLGNFVDFPNIPQDSTTQILQGVQSTTITISNDGIYIIYFGGNSVASEASSIVLSDNNITACKLNYENDLLTTELHCFNEYTDKLILKIMKIKTLSDYLYSIWGKYLINNGVTGIATIGITDLNKMSEYVNQLGLLCNACAKKDCKDCNNSQNYSGYNDSFGKQVLNNDCGCK